MNASIQHVYSFYSIWNCSLWDATVHIQDGYYLFKVSGNIIIDLLMGIFTE